jgi:hypothetical protein
MIKNFIRPLVLGIVILLAASAAMAQARGDVKTIRVPHVIRGLTGGEHVDYYVFRAKKGQKLRIDFSWKLTEDYKERDGGCSFTVSRSLDDYNPFGKASKNGRSWFGTAPRAGKYYIDVVAHPSARYTLRLK